MFSIFVLNLRMAFLPIRLLFYIILRIILLSSWLLMNYLHLISIMLHICFINLLHSLNLFGPVSSKRIGLNVMGLHRCLCHANLDYINLKCLMHILDHMLQCQYRIHLLHHIKIYKATILNYWLHIRWRFVYIQCWRLTYQGRLDIFLYFKPSYYYICIKW